MHERGRGGCGVSCGIGTSETPNRAASPDAANRSRTLVWLDARQSVHVSRACAAAGLEVVAVGSPTSPGSTPHAGEPGLGDVFTGAARVQDLRHSLATLEVDVAFICTPWPEEGIRAGAQQSVLDDPAVLSTCRERSIRLLPLEPVPASLADYRTMPAPGAAPPIEMVPLMVRSPTILGLGDAVSAIGPIRSLFLSVRCGLGQGTAAARLFDAMSLIHSFLGQPESIDCSVVPPGAASGVHPSPPEFLRALRGDVTANLRFSAAQAASLSISDRAGPWFRGITLLGDQGCIRMTDDGVEVHGPDGSPLEVPVSSQSKQPVKPTARTKKSGASEADTGVRVLSDQIQRALDPRRPAQPPLDLPQILAMCEAALLSARTGQNESPATMLRMNALG